MAERDLVPASGIVSWKFVLTIMSVFFALSWFFALQSTDGSRFLERTSLILPTSQLLDPLSIVKTETYGHTDIDPSIKNRSILNDDEEESEGSQETGSLVAKQVEECHPDNGTILKVYLYDLPSEFHFGLLDWKPRGENGSTMWPNVQVRVPSHPGGLNLQHSIEYWLTLDLLSSEFANSTEGRSAVRVHNSTEADVVFVPFFSSLSYNRFSKVNPHQKKSTNAMLQDKLVDFLMNREEWKQSGGRDHVIPAHHPNSMLRARMKLSPAMFILSDFGRYPPNIANIDKDIIAPS